MTVRSLIYLLQEHDGGKNVIIATPEGAYEISSVDFKLPEFADDTMSVKTNIRLDVKLLAGDQIRG